MIRITIFFLLVALTSAQGTTVKIYPGESAAFGSTSVSNRLSLKIHDYNSMNVSVTLNGIDSNVTVLCSNVRRCIVDDMVLAEDLYTIIVHNNHFSSQLIHYKYSLEYATPTVVKRNSSAQDDFPALLLLLAMIFSCCFCCFTVCWCITRVCASCNTHTHHTRIELKMAPSFVV